MPPSYIFHLWGLYSLLSGAFWIWMCIDCYQRRRGLDTWHYLFFFFPPSTAIYFVAHFRQIVGSTKRINVLGMGAKSRIAQAQQNLRIGNTLAARIELAELYFEAEQFENCETEFRLVLVEDPAYLEAFYHIGLCRLKANDAAGALENLTVVMARDKKLRFGLAWLRYADALAAVGRRDEALEERRKLSRSFPRPLTEFAYAELLAESGQKEKARAVLAEMLETSHAAPVEDRVFLKRGKTLLKQLA